MRAKFVNENLDLDEGIRDTIAKGLAGAAIVGSMMGTPKITQARDAEPIETSSSFRSTDVVKKQDRRGNVIIAAKKHAKIVQSNYSCEFYRIDRKNKSRYFVMLSIIEQGKVPSNSRGITIFFDDGTKLDKPNARIEPTVYSLSSYEHLAELELTKEETNTFAEKKIKSFTIYGEHDNTANVSSNDAQDFMEQVFTIVNVK